MKMIANIFHYLFHLMREISNGKNTCFFLIHKKFILVEYVYLFILNFSILFLFSFKQYQPQ